jgi:hypothetical protein
MNEQERRHWILERLKHSLQALAIPASEQVSLFPDFVIKTEELILEFEHWRVTALKNYRADLTDKQCDSLAAIDAHSTAPSKEVWDESALASHPFWQHIRRLAKESLDAFEWPLDAPKSYAREYVRGKQT